MRHSTPMIPSFYGTSFGWARFTGAGFASMDGIGRDE